MTLSMDNLQDNLIITHKGDLIINGDVGAHVTIFVESGSLTVLGNIGNHCRLIVQKTPESSLANQTFFNRNCEPKTACRSANFLTQQNELPSETIKVDGHIGNHVVIETDSADTSVAGMIGSHFSLTSETGNIDLNDVAKYATIISDTGQIYANDINENAIVRTTSGSIFIKKIGESSYVETETGTVCFEYSKSSCVILSHKGNIKHIPTEDPPPLPPDYVRATV